MSKSNSNDLTLYHFAGTTSLSVNIMLEWTGQSAHTKRIKPAETLSGLKKSFADKINPSGAVPALVLPSGLVLSQNVAILQYLAKKAGREDLIGGADLEDQAQVLKWSSFAASDLHTSFNPVFFTDRFTTSKDPKALEETKAAGIQLVLNKLAIIEKHLADGRSFFVTDKKTVVDAQMYVFTRFVLESLPEGSLAKFKKLDTFKARMDKDDGVKAALKYEDKSVWGLVRE
jgi:glutathione S-transferase